MHVCLAARHVELSDELRAYVEDHLVAPLREHTRLTINRVEVQLFEEGTKGGCHVLVSVKGHHDINVRELQDGGLYAAIDVAKDRVVRQLTEIRDKILTQSRHPKKFSFGRLGRALGRHRSNRTREARATIAGRSRSRSPTRARSTRGWRAITRRTKACGSSWRRRVPACRR